jgi:hypothetical protein
MASMQTRQRPDNIIFVLQVGSPTNSNTTKCLEPVSVVVLMVVVVVLFLAVVVVVVVVAVIVVIAMVVFCQLYVNHTLVLFESRTNISRVQRCIIH